MKAYSDRRPDSVTVEKLGSVAVVTMRRNIESRIIDDERLEFSWDERRRAFPWFDGIASSIDADPDQWWSKCGQRTPQETTTHDVESAVADLSEAVSTGASDMADVEDAIADLSEIVSELVPREE